jgi:two-component system, NtrC family, sensor histidine kinase KinB
MFERGEKVLPDNSRASLELLYNISRELTSTLDLHTVLGRVLFLSIKNVGAERGSLVSLNEAGNPVDAAFVFSDQLHSHALQQLQGTLEQGLAGWVVRNRTSALIADTNQDKRWVKRDYEGSGPSISKSAICVPVLARDTLVGVLTIVHSQPGFFTQEHLALVEAIALQAGTAINNAQLYDSLQSVNRRYRELFEDSIDPILITNLDGKVLEANRQAVRSLGYDLPELLNHQVFQFHEAHLELLGENFCELDEGQIINYESGLVTVSGSTIPVSVYVRKVNLGGETTIQWIFRDISERKTLDAMREDLIAMIYHDLRSPLANIVSSLDMLEAMVPADSAPSLGTLFTITSRSIDRMQRLINSLLDINRLEAGQPITSQTAVDIHVLGREAVEAILPMTDSKQQEVRVDLPDDLPLVWVDADITRRVFINLLENATKFTPMQGKLTVGGKKDGDCVRFWVEDTGPGIPADARDIIFDKFTRLQGERHPKGLGLGLSFCRLAVQAQGGNIWVEGDVGQGSRFVFTLPAAKNV